MARLLVAITILFIQQLVFAVILCPLAALYLCGLVITGGISLWRLILRDYGEVDGGANLQPALNVLYSLALFQGVLFCYRFFSYSASDQKWVRQGPIIRKGKEPGHVRCGFDEV